MAMCRFDITNMEAERDGGALCRLRAYIVGRRRERVSLQEVRRQKLFGDLPRPRPIGVRPTGHTTPQYYFGTGLILIEYFDC